MSAITTVADEHPELRIGLALTIMSFAVFLQAVMGALVKLLGTAYPIIQLLFVRNLFALVPLGFLVYATGFDSLRTANWLGHALRAILGLLATAGFFLSLALLPFVDAITLGFMSPLCTAILCWPLLGERVRPQTWIAIVVGFLGVLIILRPDAVPVSYGAVVALGGTLFLTLSRIAIRQLSRTESSVAITTYFSLSCVVVTGLLLPFGWRIPNLFDGLVMVGIGISGGLSQYCLAQAHRFASPAFIGPLDYTSLGWAALFGVLFWGEVPSWSEVAGAVLIVCSGFVLLHARPDKPSALSAPHSTSTVSNSRK